MADDPHGSGRTAPAAPTAGCIEHFLHADGRGETSQGTRAVLVWDASALHVRFECRDRDPWATLRERDAALWQEEVVELFLAPGPGTPLEYVELEVNPLGTVFDAWVRSPHGDRRDMEVDRGWDWQGAECRAQPEPDGWSVDLLLPWSGLGLAVPPPLWRANLYRIDRPRDGSPAELGCWSPTHTAPADFHRPARFGLLALAGHPDLRDLAVPAVAVPLLIVPGRPARSARAGLR